MPYEVTKDGAEFVCRKKGGAVLGRHKTRAEAEAQMRALNAGERRGAGKAEGLDDAGELLVMAGDSVKALDGAGHFGGYLIRFGSPQQTDATRVRDYFTAESDLGRFARGEIDLLFHHGLPTVKGHENDLADAVIGSATLKADDVGWWLDGRLDLAVPGVPHLWGELKASDDALGLSSGAVNHRVIRVPQDNGSHWLKRWPVAEASLTYEPAERLTAAVALKSLLVTPDPGATLIESSERLVADARELRALYAKALDQRLGEGRSLSTAKLSELEALRGEFGGVAEEIKRLIAASSPRPDPARLRAADERLGRLRERIGIGNP